MSQNEENPWQTLNKTEVYDSPWIKVIEHDVLNPAQQKGIYSVVNFKDIAIGIVPISEDDHTWLVGQYRYPIQEYTWEIPEGGGPLSEPVLQSAKRELLEETGITAQNWQKIQEMYLSNSATDEKSITFLAQDLSFQEPQPDDTEDLTIRKVSLQKAFDMVENGTINDAISVNAFLKIQLMWEEKLRVKS